MVLMRFAVGYRHGRRRMVHITWKSLSTCNNKVIVWISQMEVVYAPPLQSLKYYTSPAHWWVSALHAFVDTYLS